MSRIFCGSFLTLIVPLLTATPAALLADANRADGLLKELGLQRGVCVVLGDSELALHLARRGDLLVYTQLPQAEQVAELRRAADEHGVLGQRITIEHGTYDRLHLASDLADAIFVGESAREQLGREELLRVLRPAGTAFVGEQRITKPVPERIDDWSHPYHGPDNNPQSNDEIARAPYLTHFLAEPWYSPMPLVTVASNGRLFKAFGHIAIKEREWPLLNTLICQNAYNGTILWQQKLSPTFMIHRNTMIATPETLYLADDHSCKLIDAATGEPRGEIMAPEGDGPVWKWMSLVDGVLYALVGKVEDQDPQVKGDRKARGWPWGGPLGKGYNSKVYPWGFGNTLLALDPQTRQVKWKHREDDPLDARGMCLAGGRIYFYSHGKFLGCLDAETGRPIWKSTDPAVIQAIGEHKFAQNPREGFSSSAFVKAGEKALYFAGPTRTDLCAVSTETGKLLWTQPKAGNSQLVLRPDGLYAMSPEKSAKYDFLTGKILADLGPRVNCTRATGSADSIFVRGGRDGTIRYDLTSTSIGQQDISPMRPSCQDGVIPSFGHLYWGPWMCDCNLTLVGVVSLAPAGPFDFIGKPQAAERLETTGTAARSAEPSARDWPTLRANNARTAFSPVTLPAAPRPLWQWEPATKGATSASAAYGQIFTAGRDGSVRALDAATGQLRWTRHTGGAIYYPPTVAAGGVYVGSADGWVYCLDPTSGQIRWRFRAAPADRLIPVYGSFSSTWPVASGVLVQDGVAYAAAGIANHDGTHVYALDAARGHVLWHNPNSGSLNPDTRSGVSVNGHLLLAGNQLHLAGGNRVPVGSYHLADGRCSTDPSAPQSHTQFKAGSDLFLVGNQVQAGGGPLYSSRGDYRMLNQAVLQTPPGDVVVAYGPHDSRVAWHQAGTAAEPESKPLWQQRPLNRIVAVAVTPDVVVVSGNRDPVASGGSLEPLVVALRTSDGSTLWSQPLPALPSSWGLLVDRDGRVIVTLEDGRVLAFGA